MGRDPALPDERSASVVDRLMAAVCDHVRVNGLEPDAMRDNIDLAEHQIELDISFHEAIARAGRNPLFAILVGSFRVVTRETRPIDWASRPKDGSRRASIECHAAIAAAIRDRNTALAEKAVADHFDSTVKTLINAGVT